MRTNCSMEALTSIRFGYSYVGQQKAMKLRFKLDRATAIFNRLPTHFHQHISVFISLKGHVTLACVAYQTSYIWTALEQAIRLSEADVLRAKAQDIINKM